MPDKAADISEAEDDPEDDLEFLIPCHQLLDNTAAKHKSNLVQRRIPTRNKPNLDVLMNRAPCPDMLETPQTSNPRLVSKYVHCTMSIILT